MSLIGKRVVIINSVGFNGANSEYENRTGKVVEASGMTVRVQLDPIPGKKESHPLTFDSGEYRLL